jgi:2-keto-3-deoxy-L-fuconate dehydrogenase
MTFATAGAAVVCNDVDLDSVEDTVGAIKSAGGTAIAAFGDVSSSKDVASLVASADEFGGVDVMHANAAISIYDNLEVMAEETLDAIIAVNLHGALLCARAVIPQLRARGGGSIIFTSSVQGFQGLAGCVPYAAAKAGLVAAAKTLAVEVGRDGIRVNAIAPGTIDTPMLRRDLAPMGLGEREQFVQRLQAANALGRIGEAEEVAAAALFLASEASSYITGSCIVVDGGFLAVKAI